MIQNANNLFDNFVDDALIPLIIENASSPASTAGSGEGCGNELHTLHQSTDSGLSVDVTNGTCNSHNITSKLNAQNFDELSGNSVSPDSALFEIPMSECSGDDERFFQSRKTMFKKNKCSVNDIKIEEHDVCYFYI